MRFIAGELLNFLETARAITPSPAVDPLFPAARLYDGYAEGVCRHASNAADPRLTFDLALLGEDGNDNGDFNTWVGGAPVGWTETTSGGGTVVETTAADEFRTGSAAKMNKSAGVARVTKTYRVRSGQRLNASLWLRIAGSGQAKAQLYNPVTKRYLTDAGLWQTAQAFFATETAATTYQEKALAFTVEDFRACGDEPTARLELSIEDTGPGGGSDFAFVDDAFLIPTWNAIVVAGHNLEPGMTPQLRSSTNNFGGSDSLEATLTVRQPSFFGYLSTPSTRRYARLALTGTQSAQTGAPYYGEVVITYLETAAIGPNDGWSVRYFADNIVNQPPGGKILAARTLQQQRRAFRLNFELRVATVDEFLEHRNEIRARCHGSLWPLIVVPINAEETVCHGRADDSYEARRLFSTIWDSDMLLSDNPFARVT